MNNEDRRFYVYAYIRLDVNTYFYIGKGTRNRWKDINNRNPHFKNIIKNIDYTVEILHDNLTESEAFQLEEDTICDLVFNEGYSIEIKDFCKRNIGTHLVNQSFGGEGSSGYKCSDECRKAMSENRKGKNNQFYGKNHSEYTKNKISEKRIKTECAKGENNPNYGKRGNLSPIKGRKHLNEELNKMSLSNPLRKEVYCIELDVKFQSLTKAEQYMRINYLPKFSRRPLSKRLNGELDIDWYGEIYINGELTKLHWVYV